MAKKKSSSRRRSKKTARRKPSSSQLSSRSAGYSSSGFGGPPLRPGYLVTLRKSYTKAGLSAMFNAAGSMKVATSGEFNTMSAGEEAAADNDVLLLESTNIAIVDMDPDQAMSVMAVSGGEILSVDPEPIFITYNLDYLRGFRDAVNHIADALLDDQQTQGVEQVPTAVFQDNASFTWGLEAIGANTSGLSGNGVRVAVLDTGMDLDHPDFGGRSIVSRSFISGQAVQDENGHGTHCTGTACGPRSPGSGRGYGVAYGCDIFVGKVLSNQGSSLGRSTLRGIEWAIEQGVDVISLSLGAPVAVGESFVPAFEQVGQTAIEHGILVVAAAGNESRRGIGRFRPVGSPANCPSFMAVGAVDNALNMGDFSNRALNSNGGEVDLVGPGVDVFSSAPEPAAPRQPPYFRQWSARYDTIDGTSMATPHVAGVAALFKEANPNADAVQLKNLLLQNCQSLPLRTEDVGSGLVQAPAGTSGSGMQVGGVRRRP